MVQEVETNRLIHLYTPLFFGWTISLIGYYLLFSNLVQVIVPTSMVSIDSNVGVHSSSNHNMCSSVLYNLHLLFLVIPLRYLFCCKYKYVVHVPYYMTAVSDKVLLFNVVHKTHNIY